MEAIMNWLPKIVAILIVIDGIVILLRPDLSKKYCQLFCQGAAIYLDALIKALVGAAFLFGASDKCNHQWVIITFGILAFAGAVFIVIMPQKARVIAGWFAAKSNTTLRLFSLIYLLIGALLVYSS
jgi:uncharacterized protein YjeT (DUF2065 family)